MRLLTISALVSLAGLAAAMTGCEASGAGAPTGLVRPGAVAEARPARASVYVTQANGADDGIVYGYGANDARNRAPACTITGQKFDHSQIAVDASGAIYLPNLETGAINVYGPECGGSIASVRDPYGADVDVALGSGGAFYGVGRAHVSVCTLSGCTNELTDPSIFQLETAAVDSSGNVWAAYYDQGGTPSLIVWPGGSMPGKPVSGYANMNTPGDLSFDRHGNLLSVQTLFAHVYLYRCDVTAASCTNTKIVSLRNGALYGALNAANTDFQATDYEGDAVDVYSYPGFAYRYSYSRGLKQGYSAQGIAQTL